MHSPSPIHKCSDSSNLLITALVWVGQHFIWLFFFLPKFTKIINGRGSNLYLRKHPCLPKSSISSDCHQCQFITTVNYTVFEQCSVTSLAQAPVRFLLLIVTVCRHPWDLCPTARHPLWRAPLCFGVQCPAEGTDNYAPKLWCSHPLSSTRLQELCAGLSTRKPRGQSWARQWWIQPCRLPTSVPPNTAWGCRGTDDDTRRQDMPPYQGRWTEHRDHTSAARIRIRS